MPAPVQAVFDRRCNMPGCHGEQPTPSVPLSLLAGNSGSIIGQTASQSPLPLVEPGSVDNSYLAHKIMATPPTPIAMTRMPQGVSFDDAELQADLALVVGWIEGADLGACGGGTDSGSDTSASTTATTMTTEASSDSSTGEPEPALCGIEDLKPGAPNPIVAGDAAGQIPTEIGEILADNCGCHYADAPFSRDALSDYTGMAPMATLEDWQGPNYAGSPTTVIAVSEAYIANDGPGGMPPVFGQCDIGDG
ncbi:MAG: hypothetical protein IAG13_14050, partial [Deltaproteobacteria bacterium]|nr:hypothetical protein [Nannocystaceae bacterium]